MNSSTGFAAIPVWLLRSEKFTHSEKEIYLHLASFAGYKTINPSHETLAQLSGYGKRTVQSAVAGLVEKGVVEIRSVYRRSGSGGRAQNHYRLVSAPWGENEEEVEASEGLPAKSAGKPEGVTGKKVQGLPAKTCTDSLLNIDRDIYTYSAAARGQQKEQEIEEAFSEWYALYPNKKGRDAALRAYRAAFKKVKGDKQVLLDALRRDIPKMQESITRNGGSKRYVKHPATWLNAGSWKDEDDAQGEVAGGFVLDPVTAAAWQNIQQQAVTYAR